MGRHGGKAPEVPEQERQGSAGQPAHYRETTIDPTGGDGPPTEAYTALDAPDDHEARPTEGYRVPTPIADQVPRTGFGSARRAAPKLGPVARAIVRAQRWRRVKRIAFGALFGLLAIPVTLTGAYCGYLAYGYRDDLTYIETREMTPVFAILSSVLFVFLAALVVLYRDGRNG